MASIANIWLKFKTAVPAVIAQIFNPSVELVNPLEIPSKEAKTEINIHPVTAEAKIRKCSIKFRVAQTFLSLLLINLFCSVSSAK